MLRGLRLSVLVVVLACRAEYTRSGGREPRSLGLDSARAREMVDSVRVFAAGVAQGVSDRGPGAWRDYFADGPSFFMANEGQLLFPTGDSARRGIETLRGIITHIELRWGDPVRVDPLVPGLAVMGAPWREVRVMSGGHTVRDTGYFTGVVEHGAQGWLFRDVHWSVVAPPSAVP